MNTTMFALLFSVFSPSVGQPEEPTFNISQQLFDTREECAFFVYEMSPTEDVIFEDDFSWAFLSQQEPNNPLVFYGFCLNEAEIIEREIVIENKEFNEIVDVPEEGIRI